MARRFGGIGSGLAVHAVESLSSVVPGFEVGVAQLPIGAGTLLHRQLAELSLAHPLEHRAPDLGVAPRGHHHLGGKGIAIGADPLLARVVAAAAEQVDGGHVLIGKRQGKAPLQQQHRQARLSQLTGQGAAAGAAAHDEHIKQPLLHQQAATAGLLLPIRVERRRNRAHRACQR